MNIMIPGPSPMSFVAYLEGDKVLGTQRSMRNNLSSNPPCSDFVLHEMVSTSSVSNLKAICTADDNRFVMTFLTDLFLLISS